MLRGLGPGRSFTLGQGGAASSHTGDTNEWAGATVTLPANMLGVNGLLRITHTWTFTGSANAKTLRVRLGGIAGTVIFSLGTGTNTGTGGRWETVTQNRNAANSQYSTTLGPRVSDTLITCTVTGATAVDTTASQDIAITGQLASSGETITLEDYLVEVLRV